jgi:hypothetical protein
MTVREAIDLLDYGTAFYIKGACSGKIYHKSYENKKEHLEKFLDKPVSRQPFFTDLYTSKAKYSQAYTYPVIGIWMNDYYLCHPKE